MILTWDKIYSIVNRTWCFDNGSTDRLMPVIGVHAINVSKCQLYDQLGNLMLEFMQVESNMKYGTKT